MRHIFILFHLQLCILKVDPANQQPLKLKNYSECKILLSYLKDISKYNIWYYIFLFSIMSYIFKARVLSFVLPR